MDDSMSSTWSGEMENITQNFTSVNPELESHIDDMASHYLTYKIGLVIHWFYYPIIIPIGVVGNTLSFAIMLMKRNRKHSFCVYLAALAITDNLVLLVSAFIATGLSSKCGVACCQVIGFTFHSFASSSVGIILAINLDRYLATCHPFTSHSWRTPSRALIVVVVIIVLAIASGWLYSGTSSQVNSFTCGGFTASNEMKDIILCISYTIVFALLPCAAVVYMNVAISKKMKESHRKLKKIQSARARKLMDCTRKNRKDSDSVKTDSEIRQPENSEDGSHGTVEAVFDNAIGKTVTPDALPGHDNEDHDTRQGNANGIIIMMPLANNDIHIDTQTNSNNAEDVMPNSLEGHNTSPTNNGDIPENNVSVSDVEEEWISCCCRRKTMNIESTETTVVNKAYRDNSRQQAEKQIHKALLLVTIAFFVLVLPQFLRYIVFVFMNIRSSASLFATYILIYQVSQKMNATNSAINVFIYCLNGSRFRRDLLQIFKSKKCSCCDADVYSVGSYRSSTN